MMIKPKTAQYKSSFFLKLVESSGWSMIKSSTPSVLYKRFIVQKREWKKKPTKGFSFTKKNCVVVNSSRTKLCREEQTFDIH